MGFLNLDVKYKQPKILAVIFISLCFATGVNQTYPQLSIHRELLAIDLNTSKHDTAPNEPNYRLIGAHPCNGEGNENFRHMVSITSFYTYPICTGSLLSSKWVLTAAHCGSLFVVHYVTPAYIRERCMSPKEVEYYLPKSCPSTRVSRWYFHPSWNYRRYLNDVALLKLASPIHQTDKIQYVKLPSQPSIPVNRNGPDLCPETTVMGYGFIHEASRKLPKKAMCVNLKLLYEKDCKKRLSKFMTVKLNTQICSNSSTEKDCCHGDSGGPMMCGDTQIGITSWGPAACASGYPSVFARVDRYLKFIREVTNRGTSTVAFNYLYLFFNFGVINTFIIM